MDFKISRQASSVIDDIIRYTDKNFGDAQTAEYLDGLYYSFSLIAENPRLGRAWGAGERRLYVYRQHYVFYRVADGHILITDIRNIRQDIPPEWRSE